MAGTECHHAQDGLKIVTIETLSRVDSTECLHAQDGLGIVTSETLSPEIGLFFVVMISPHSYG